MAILTVSDTRTAATDQSGDLMQELATAAGHTVLQRGLVPDDAAQVQAWIRNHEKNKKIDVVLINGGTGISTRDRTYEAVTELIERPLPGFGELFRALSFRQIGAAAMASRATAGIAGSTVIFCTPGSPAAVRLAMEELILPEAPHLVGELRRPD